MNDTSSDTRIAIEEFEDFATCRLVGQQFGMRYQAFCEAFTAALNDPELKQSRIPAPRQVTDAQRNREPSWWLDDNLDRHEARGSYGGAIGQSQLPWGY